MDWFTSPLATENDAELISRLRRRDPAAAGELYERYGRLLFSLILNIVGDRQDAEDVLAETLLKASNRVQTFATNHFAVGSWLLILARNHALNFRAQKRGAVEMARDSTTLESPVLYLAGVAAAAGFLGTPAAQKVFASLAEVDRVILELAWFEAMTFDDIALRLGIPAADAVASAKRSLASIRES